MYPYVLSHLSRPVFPTLFSLCLLVTFGCGRGPQPSAARVGRVFASSSAAADALASVRAQPLYRKAVQACRRKRYEEAAGLLQRLSIQAGLNAQEVAFAQQQRRICLQDAHLPVPPVSHATPAAASLSASAIVLHSASRASEADCGPRALLLLCRHEGIEADVTQLRCLAHTTQDGTSLSGLEAAARAVGLKAEGVQVSREALSDVDMPALAYVNGNHFIAVLSVQGKGDNATVTIHDPNERQEQTIGQERLLRLCSGYLLLAHK